MDCPTLDRAWKLSTEFWGIYGVLIYTIDLITIYLCDLGLPLQEAKNDVRLNVLVKVDFARPNEVLHLNRDKV